MSNRYQAFEVTGTSLEGVRMLAPLPLAERNAIAERCTGRRYRTGAMVVSSEANDDEVYFLLSGSCRVSYFSSSGREVSFRDQEPGEMFGEISAIDGRGRSATVVARAESTLAVLQRDDFLDLIYQHQKLAHATLVHLTTIIRNLSNRVIEFSTLGVKNRIHAELLRIAGDAAEGAEHVVITPSPRHADIAARVSTHREAVTREFSELQKAGIIERTGNRLRICNLNALRQMVADPTRHG
jgi:CRP-like cAMP-binding protein